jgi:DNA-binding transcriptional ArsR family regulator
LQGLPLEVLKLHVDASLSPGVNVVTGLFETFINSKMNKFIQKWIFAMRFHNILDEILGNRTKVKLLRAFTTYPGKEFSESELQRIAGIPQASVHRNVGALFENGLLQRRRIGKANLYSMNRGHVLFPTIDSLFEEERNLLKKLKKTIAGKINKIPEVKLAVLFGSVMGKGRQRCGPVHSRQG